MAHRTSSSQSRISYTVTRGSRSVVEDDRDRSSSVCLLPAERPTLPAASEHPRPIRFGKYFLAGLLARGGMADVYRAALTEVLAPAALAIKLIRPVFAGDPQFVEMFEREGQLALRLRHPCIVETLDADHVDGRRYIAMEYIRGRDLSDVLRRCARTHQRIPIPYAAYVVARVAEGLHFAHTRTDDLGRPCNIVNRDVSPSNVRLSFEGEVKLLDFGIAKTLQTTTSELGVLKGKLRYMSPEQARGLPVDARTDVFAAGVILHEMLTTEPLFKGETDFAVLDQVCRAEVLPPSRFNRRVGAELDAIVGKALARDVHDRYQTAGDLAAALDDVAVNYRFAAGELRQFMRHLFRDEHMQEAALPWRSPPPTLTPIDATRKTPHQQGR